ncbi:hypothetical protein ACFL35_17345 [Candidatus Riflebacteria bacterium]
MPKTKKIMLPEQKIREMFKTAECSADILGYLYELAYGKEHLEKISIAWPTINNRTNSALFQLFIKLDREKSPRFLAGGLWMNKGFSEFGGEHLGDWQAEVVIDA